MRILTRYILIQTLMPFLAALCVFLLALSLERLLRLVDDVTAYNASLVKALELLLYLQPHYLGLAIPAALFIACMLAVRNFLEHAELDVMRATGHNLNTLQKPILVISCTASVIMLFLTGYAQPHSRYTYRAELNEIKAAPKTIPIRAGVFQNFGPNTVIHAMSASAEENYLGQFFASTTDEQGLKTHILAQHAYIQQGTQNTALLLNLVNGQIIKHAPGGEPKRVEFETYPWQPDITASAYGLRGQDERELTLGELLNSKIQIENSKKAQEKPYSRTAEFHARVTHALSLPFLCLLAIPLALIGQGRTGRALGIIIGVIGLVAYEKILGFGEAFAADGSISPILSLWVPFLILANGSIFLTSRLEQRAGS